MNRIVREHYPASKLPPDLRQGLGADASVTVTIQEEAPRRLSPEELRQQLQTYRQGLSRHSTLDEAVARVRELRDEWDA